MPAQKKASIDVPVDLLAFPSTKRVWRSSLELYLKTRYCLGAWGSDFSVEALQGPDHLPSPPILVLTGKMGSEELLSKLTGDLWVRQSTSIVRGEWMGRYRLEDPAQPFKELDRAEHRFFTSVARSAYALEAMGLKFPVPHYVEEVNVDRERDIWHIQCVGLRKVKDRVVSAFFPGIPESKLDVDMSTSQISCGFSMVLAAHSGACHDI